MSRCRVAALLGSILLGPALLLALLAWAGLDLREALQLLSKVRAPAIITLVVLMAGTVFLSAEKWRLLILADPTAARFKPSRATAFALTAVGVALGQMVPVQISTLICRALGARALGKYAVVRGVGATLIEQCFDLAVGALAGLASVTVILAGRGAEVWLIGTVIALGVGYALCHSAASAAARACTLGRFSEGLSHLADLAILSPGMARRLFALSVLRFALLVLVWAAAARALSVEIPVWHLAAAFPFAIFANALALTPGGIGISEWTVTSVLVALGTSAQMAAQWAVATRILVLLATALMGILAVFLMCVVRWSSRLRPRRALEAGAETPHS